MTKILWRVVRVRVRRPKAQVARVLEPYLAVAISDESHNLQFLRGLILSRARGIEIQEKITLQSFPRTLLKQTTPRLFKSMNTSSRYQQKS